MAVVGYDYVKRQCADESMKSLSAAVFPLMEKCREDGIGVPNSQKPAATAATASAPSTSANKSSSTAASSFSAIAAQAGPAPTAAVKKQVSLAFLVSFCFLLFIMFAAERAPVFPAF